MPISKAIEGYLIYADARLSPATIRDYTNTFNKFVSYLGVDVQINDITPAIIEGFLGSWKQLKKKTILNYHVGLSALWTWASERGFAETQVPQKVRPPKPDTVAVVPFTEQDIRLLLGSCDHSRICITPGKRTYKKKTSNGSRMKTTILLLLDTGIRVQEFCDLKVKDVDLRNRYITVFGKGRKGRQIPISPRTAQALWAHFAEHPSTSIQGPAFSTIDGLKQQRGTVQRSLNIIGDRAGVLNVHPHRFRHTFAINYLRNGGDIYTLQQILGHSTLDMVRRYLALAQADIANAHRIASPVMNWGL